MIRWPDKEKHGLSVSEEAKDLISRVNNYCFTLILIIHLNEYNL